MSEDVNNKKGETSPHGTGAEKLASKLENNNEKEFSKREVKK
ncbi:MAG: hypothetical protein QW478_15210 [Candidatus Micrarchaeaceae archaeon]